MIRCVTFGNCAAACVGVLRRGHRVQVARQHQRRHVGKLRLRRQRIALRIRRQRLRPVETRRERREVRLRRERFVDRERREQVGTVLARILDAARVLPAPLRGRIVQVVVQRILLADHRLILTVAEVDGVADERRVVFGGEPQQRQLVVIVEPGARGRIEIAIRDRRVAQVRHQQEQHRNVDGHFQRDAVRVRRSAADRLATQLAQQALDARGRLAAQRATRRRSLAHEVEPVASGRPVGREPDVRRAHRIRAVENQAAQPLADATPRTSGRRTCRSCRRRNRLRRSAAHPAPRRCRRPRDACRRDTPSRRAGRRTPSGRRDRSGSPVWISGQSIAPDVPVPRLSMMTTSRCSRSEPKMLRYASRVPVVE